MIANCAYPRTPTVHTRVRSPLILSVPIRFITRPVVTSHFRRLLSEPPVTNHESLQFSSSSSSELPSLTSVFWCRGTGGPQAMLNIRHFTRSNRRRWVKVSFAMDNRRTVPSSQPSARELEDGLAAIDQIEPPCEPMVL